MTADWTSGGAPVGCQRKSLALIGYGLGAATKPLFALAPSVGVVLTARPLDRVGNGIRGAPRDALVADIAPPEVRGAAFGLRQSLDTVGAFAGPPITLGLMLLWANNFQAVLWVAVIPGATAVALLAFRVKELPPTPGAIRQNLVQRDSLARLPVAYWQVVGIGAVFTLARFSEAFLVQRAQHSGIPLAIVALVMVAIKLVYALSPCPFGKLSDRISHKSPLIGSLAVLIVADIILASSAHWAVVLAGVAVWGLHMGMTQALLAVVVARQRFWRVPCSVLRHWHCFSGGYECRS